MSEEFGINKEYAKENYNCEILISNGTWEQVTNKDYPMDSKIVTYVVDDKTCYDLTRSTKISKIFDLYWDEYRSNLKSIDFSMGKINPKLWGYKQSQNKNKK